MLELILSGLGGLVAGVVGVALRQRQPGDSLLDTIVRPFGAGGPGPRR